MTLHSRLPDMKRCIRMKLAEAADSRNLKGVLVGLLLSQLWGLCVGLLRGLGFHSRNHLGLLLLFDLCREDTMDFFRIPEVEGTHLRTIRMLHPAHGSHVGLRTSRTNYDRPTATQFYVDSSLIIASSYH